MLTTLCYIYTYLTNQVVAKDIHIYPILHNLRDGQENVTFTSVAVKRSIGIMVLCLDILPINDVQFNQAH